MYWFLITRKHLLALVQNYLKINFSQLAVRILDFSVQKLSLESFSLVGF